VKCRPPNNRAPTKEEMQICSPYLVSQLQVISPKLIITLGATALSFFMDKKNISITKVRGKIFEWKGGINVYPMFHPSYLLRNQSKEPGSPKAVTWHDIKEVRRMYDDFTKS